MKKPNTLFSDLITGYITRVNFDADLFSIKTAGNIEFEIKLTPNTSAEIMRNLDGKYQSTEIKNRLLPDQYVFVYGIYYPADNIFEAKHLLFPGKTTHHYLFEEPDWWIQQIKQIADFYLDAQFEKSEIDYKNYRTNLFLNGQKLPSGIQETASLSRTIYGFATAYLLTGEDYFLNAAEKGCVYLQTQTCEREQETEGFIYWAHALEKTENGFKKHIGSLAEDDWKTIPLYEQIYALSGLTQTYRITGNQAILDDIRKTLNFIHHYFKDDSDYSGFYSHITADTFDPNDKRLLHNQSRKNWNSIGDHAPAYLFNLWLATGETGYQQLLEQIFDLIVLHFPVKDSPFVQERFYADWKPDSTWKWQQDRAVVGHNFKIAWNLMRMYALTPKPIYLQIATQLINNMTQVGIDQQRGGCYDVMERHLKPNEHTYRLAFHDRKAWWQQEQAILAYLILFNYSKDAFYLKTARECASFYNAYFLDTQSGGIYFNVLANGIPYLLDTERMKGSHAMGMYHQSELCYLATVYQNLIIAKQPLNLFFKPQPKSFKDNLLRVAPDLLPLNCVKINAVWIDDQPYLNFDAINLTVQLPPLNKSVRVKVQLIA